LKVGDQKVVVRESKSKKAKFIGHLLDDVKALEYMLENGLIETGITRIGAEQEFCLVKKDWRPADNSEEILKQINDPHFTTELARYNLEINLDPIELKGDCFSKMERQLTQLLSRAEKAAEKNNTNIILTGILPTITKSHLQLDYITPKPRYYALNDRMMKLRRNNFRLHIMGVDELNIHHDSILFEACNTSFQLHLQIEPDDFISSFNWAQAISGPVLAVCANSPLLLGRELWDETRIALFRQSTDTRNISLALKDEPPRVAFGSEWISGTAASIYKENIAQYKVILSKEVEHNSLDLLQQGKIPKLEALSLHNGTIYPWNRACYGVGNGKPHLRIENRYIPAGPSIQDEMANFAFWIGLMRGRPKKFDNMAAVMEFNDAKSNFIRAARTGKQAVMTWDNEEYTVEELTQKILLPIAYSGLMQAGVDVKDTERLLNIIEHRTKKNNGAQWMISNYRALRKQQNIDDSLRRITKAIHENQRTGKTIDEWSDIDPMTALKTHANKVGQIMSTRVFTVKKTDLADMATSIMRWKNIHHVPVENKRGELCGLLTWTHVQKFRKELGDNQIVGNIMARNVISVTPNTKIAEAIAIMKEHEFGCLPVIQKKELVGIITIKDVIAFDHG